MNPLKILLLSLLSFFLLPTQNTFAYDIQAKQEWEFWSGLYKWQMPEKTAENYCQDYSYGAYGNITFNILEETAQQITWECGAEYGYSTSQGLYTFAIPQVKIYNNITEPVEKETLSRNIENWCYIDGFSWNINDYAEIIFFERTTPKKWVQVSCQNKANGQLAQVEIIYKEETQTPPPKPQIEWCLDVTAINYNPSADIHVESMCQYPPSNTPQDITGSFEKSQVSIWATTWTIKFILNVPNATLDPSTIQTWNKFTAVDSTTNDKTLTITLRQFDDQRLDVECANYEITIPRHALTTTNGDTNPNPISGNFEVVGCDGLLPTNGSWSIDVNIGSWSIDVKNNANLNKESHYLQIIGQKDWFYYIDTKALMMLLFFLLITFSCFYALFKIFFKKIY